MTWDERFAELLERAMARAVAGQDTQQLREELQKMLAERPKEKEDGSKD